MGKVVIIEGRKFTGDKEIAAANADITRAFQEVDGIPETTSALTSTTDADETTTTSRTWWSPPSSTEATTHSTTVSTTAAEGDEPGED